MVNGAETIFISRRCHQDGILNKRHQTEGMVEKGAGRTLEIAPLGLAVRVRVVLRSRFC
jgi:hypothetical protein